MFSFFLFLPYFFSICSFTLIHYFRLEANYKYCSGFNWCLFTSVFINRSPSNRMQLLSHNTFIHFRHQNNFLYNDHILFLFILQPKHRYICHAHFIKKSQLTVKPKWINVLGSYSKTYHKFLLFHVSIIFGNEDTIQDLSFVKWVGKMTEKRENNLIAGEYIYVYIYTEIYMNIY